MSKTVIEVKKGTTENNATLLRRFSRKVIDSGIVRDVKSKRYNERKISKVSQKELALRRMNRKKEVEKLKKLGKMKETKNTRRR